LTGARSSRGAGGGSRTFHLGATGSWARWAFSLGLIALGAIQNHRLGLRNRRFENIVTQVRNRRHLRFQDILAQIGYLGARRDRALKNIATHIWLSARRTGSATRSIIREPLEHRTAKCNSYNNAYQKEANHIEHT